MSRPELGVCSWSLQVSSVPELERLMNEAGAGSEILLTTEHSESSRTIAWVRQFRSARVFCLALGHDSAAWSLPGFRTVLGRGILWSAGRL